MKVKFMVVSICAESFRAPIFLTGPDKDGFSLGRGENFRQVFGEEAKYWFLPVKSRYSSLRQFL